MHVHPYYEHQKRVQWGALCKLEDTITRQRVLSLLNPGAVKLGGAASALESSIWPGVIPPPLDSASPVSQETLPSAPQAPVTVSENQRGQSLGF